MKIKWWKRKIFMGLSNQIRQFLHALTTWTFVILETGFLNVLFSKQQSYFDVYLKPCFLNFLFLHQMIALQKLGFLFHIRSWFCSWDIQIFVIFSLLFQTFQIQKEKWKYSNLWCHGLAGNESILLILNCFAIAVTF